MSRLASLLFAGTAVVAFVGCVADETSIESSAQGGDLDMDGCIKIEGAQIGVAGVSVSLDGLSVTFTSWVAKDGEPNEMRGFTAEVTSPFSYTVKAGGDLFQGATTTWTNPKGTGGSAVKGISKIVFCDPNGGDDPACTDPDGSDTGSGDPPACTNPDG